MTISVYRGRKATTTTHTHIHTQKHASDHIGYGSIYRMSSDKITKL